MLFKEYRILLPLSVDEYRIAQLYMIQKKSRDESKGAESRVEILVNEPYEKGPSETSGQYTHKIFHIGSHLPGWLKAILPKTALRVEEEAWNAYPYTKTRYTCPFVEKFSIEVETKYFNDSGHQDNVFELSPADLKRRKVDVMNIVTDKVPSSSYKEAEDPKLFRSQKSGRGPLTADWLDEKQEKLMCAYKLCKVEFRYWGLQSRIERFIDDIGLRRTMVVAHRQAWCWQDEWWGLTIDDVRRLERETQQKLRGLAEDETPEPTTINDEKTAIATTKEEARQQEDLSPSGSRVRHSMFFSAEEGGDDDGCARRRRGDGDDEMLSISSADSDIFYDAQEELEFHEQVLLMRCTSSELISESERQRNNLSPSPVHSPSCSNDEMDRKSAVTGAVPSSASLKREASSLSVTMSSKSDVLILVFREGDGMSGGDGSSSGLADCQTFQTTVNQITKMHYSFSDGRIAVRLVACPPICKSAHNLFSLLCPSSEEKDDNEMLRSAILPLIAVAQPDYSSHLDAVVDKANAVYSEFLQSPEGQAFAGLVCVVGDCLGGLLAYDVLSRRSSRLFSDMSQRSLSPSPRVSRSSSGSSPLPWTGPKGCHLDVDGQHSPRSLSPSPLLRCISAPTGASASGPSPPTSTLCFDVSDLFLFGSPVGQVIAARKCMSPTDYVPPKPDCCAIFNLCYLIDRLACRIEPLLDERAAKLPSHPICRYDFYPLGSDESSYMIDVVQSNRDVFPAPDQDNVPSVQVGDATSTASHRCRRLSDRSTYSSSTDQCSYNDIGGPSVWWNDRRIDYTLFCPKAVHAFPRSALSYWLYSSYWESKDVVAFILRQILQNQPAGSLSVTRSAAPFVPRQPRVKWNHKKTAVKIAALSSDHRGYDSVVMGGTSAQITGKFAYGPLDMVSLVGETVDVHALCSGNRQWNYLGSSDTGKHGRFSFTLPESVLGFGLHEVKLLVSGDHSVADCTLAILPPKTEAVVFSIDGAFSASVSLSGKHPKVIPKSADLVRYWQDAGYLILYITGRPDVQKPAVLSWLAQNNFPFGISYFCDGLSTEPQKHKAAFLRRLSDEVDVVIRWAYGAKKDVKMYQDAGISVDQINVISKRKASRRASKKSYNLLDDYGDHLDLLLSQPNPIVESVQWNLLPKRSFASPKSRMKRKGKRRQSPSSLSPYVEMKRSETSV